MDIMGLVIAFVVLLVLIFVATSVLGQFIRVAREYERFVVFRLGRSIGVKGPG